MTHRSRVACNVAFNQKQRRTTRNPPHDTLLTRTSGRRSASLSSEWWATAGSGGCPAAAQGCSSHRTAPAAAAASPRLLRSDLQAKHPGLHRVLNPTPPPKKKNNPKTPKQSPLTQPTRNRTHLSSKDQRCREFCAGHQGASHDTPRATSR